MSHVQVGTCPQCGAPIYGPGMWMSITPPPPMYTCSCRPMQTIVTTTGTNIELAGYYNFIEPTEDVIHKASVEYERDDTFKAGVRWAIEWYRNNT
jgi:hypothetical protein